MKLPEELTQESPWPILVVLLDPCGGYAEKKNGRKTFFHAIEGDEGRTYPKEKTKACKRRWRRRHRSQTLCCTCRLIPSDGAFVSPLEKGTAQGTLPGRKNISALQRHANRDSSAPKFLPLRVQYRAPQKTSPVVGSPH